MFSFCNRLTTVDCRHSLCAPCDRLQREGEVRQDHNEEREREDQPDMGLAIETSDSCKPLTRKANAIDLQLLDLHPQMAPLLYPESMLRL